MHKCTHVYKYVSTCMYTHMSSWCLVSQLPRTLPRGAPLRIWALARCRRCLCPQADSEPSARSRMARPTAVRVGRPQVSCPVLYMHICAKCVHTYINMSRHVCTHMSSWCLVAQLPRTLPRGAPLRILALARWRRCLCPLADSAPQCSQPHGAPSGCSRLPG